MGIFSWEKVVPHSFINDMNNDSKWIEYFNSLCHYCDNVGVLDIPYAISVFDDIRIGLWLDIQLRKLRLDLLTDNQSQLLLSLVTEQGVKIIYQTRDFSENISRFVRYCKENIKGSDLSSESSLQLKSNFDSAVVFPIQSQSNVISHQNSQFTSQLSVQPTSTSKTESKLLKIHDSWMIYYKALCLYGERKGTCNVSLKVSQIESFYAQEILTFIMLRKYLN